MKTKEIEKRKPELLIGVLLLLMMRKKVQRLVWCGLYIGQHQLLRPGQIAYFRGLAVLGADSHERKVVQSSPNSVPAASSAISATLLL